MKLLLINPYNESFGFTSPHRSIWTRFRIWKPLGLMIVAGATPEDWDAEIIDENLGVPEYGARELPDLVGLTAFTSQADRAYALAKQFRARGVPVVMGGIHASMCPDEALEHVDSVVVGEAESVWSQVLHDAQNGALQSRYDGQHLDLNEMPEARHDLLPTGYHFGSLQTSRGCPLNCSFCSVTTFNGGRFRRRPIAHTVKELAAVPEKSVLIVDDNFVGTSARQITDTKALLRAIIAAKLDKTWVTQVTVNMADDPELLDLAKEAGCAGVFIGFEAISEEGLHEIGKKFNIKRSGVPRNFRASVRRIQRRGMVVVGSFVIGLETDEPGIGVRVARTASEYGVDMLNVVYLTPFPGTRLWEKMAAEDRIAANRFPKDWRYYTLTFPVAKYRNLSWEQMIQENHACNSHFYSLRGIGWRVIRSIVARRHPLITLVANLSYRTTAVTRFFDKFRDFDLDRGASVLDPTTD